MRTFHLICYVFQIITSFYHIYTYVQFMHQWKTLYFLLSFLKSQNKVL